MKATFIISIFFILTINCFSQTITDYQSLDANNPIVFDGNSIMYQNKQINLGTKAFFIDGQLSNEEAARYEFVFNSINEAAKQLTDGTEESPMVLYIAPYVYWIDNPDDHEIRKPEQIGGTPFGLEIDCEWLRFYGLSNDAPNVVLASNRGQTMGAKGNFTMFNIIGNGLSSENITFGNYCNIDLEFPLKPELNRKKRGSAIVQAQLAFCNGDKIVARNTRFVSRLNLCPLYGGKRTLFDRCHFESTDDALAPKGVYLNCTFDFYSSKPFGHTVGTGAVLLNCDITSYTRGEQYMIKGGGPITAIDCRMKAHNSTYWGWKKNTPAEERHYQFNNLLNEKPVFIDSHHHNSTVDMADKKVLDAYRFIYKGNLVYNTYNLLRGDDDWDPMNIKHLVIAAEKEQNKNYINIPTLLKISPSQVTIETGKETVLLESSVYKFGDYQLDNQPINWNIAPEYASLVILQKNKNGTCLVVPTNNNNQPKEVVIVASTLSGLEAASVINVTPSFTNAPKFSSLPKLLKTNNGLLNVDYKLDMQYDDQSLVTWYRCSDTKGSNAIEVAVSRFNKPKLTYQLSSGDIGYYIKATVAPNHIRCNPGLPVAAIVDESISVKDIKTDSKLMNVDLNGLSTKYQSKVLPGFWTFDCYAPEDTHEYNWDADKTRDSWYYGAGVNGAAKDTGLVQATKGARLRYTPVGNSFGNMKISFTACPAKTAGQGFSSARAQYMDIGIKFDTENLNGYALRLIRTTKYADAIDCIFMKYENGVANPISDPVSTSCYRTPCYITIEVKDNKLIAHAESPAQYFVIQNSAEVLQKIDLETEISPNQFGGIEFQHTGTVGSGATLIKDLIIEWN